MRSRFHPLSHRQQVHVPSCSIYIVAGEGGAVGAEAVFCAPYKAGSSMEYRNAGFHT